MRGLQTEFDSKCKVGEPLFAITSSGRLVGYNHSPNKIIPFEQGDGAMLKSLHFTPCCSQDRFAQFMLAAVSNSSFHDRPRDEYFSNFTFALVRGVYKSNGQFYVHLHKWKRPSGGHLNIPKIVTKHGPMAIPHLLFERDASSVCVDETHLSYLNQVGGPVSSHWQCNVRTYRKDGRIYCMSGSQPDIWCATDLFPWNTVHDYVRSNGIIKNLVTST